MHFVCRARAKVKVKCLVSPFCLHLLSAKAYFNCLQNAIFVFFLVFQLICKNIFFSFHFQIYVCKQSLRARVHICNLSGTHVDTVKFILTSDAVCNGVVYKHVNCIVIMIITF